MSWKYDIFGNFWIHDANHLGCRMQNSHCFGDVFILTKQRAETDSRSGWVSVRSCDCGVWGRGHGGSSVSSYHPLLRRLMFEFSASLRLLRGSTLVCSQNLSVRFTKKFAWAPKWLSDLWYVSWIRNNGKNQVMQWLAISAQFFFVLTRLNVLLVTQEFYYRAVFLLIRGKLSSASVTKLR